MFVDEKAAGEAQTADVANRKLKMSEAIRIGAKIRPQCREQFFENGRSCALGAALDGIGLRDWAIEYHNGTVCVWPWNRVLEEFGLPSGLDQTIAHKNDIDAWTREQIADWLEAQGY